MKLFSGKLVVIVQSAKEDGEIKLLAKGSGLKSARIVLQSQKIIKANALK